MTFSEEVAVECMKRGAADYLLKDRLTRLASAVHQALAQHQLRQEKRQADAQLRAALREKEVLLRELQHRVKNNLQIIHSLLSLQASEANDSRVLAMVKECQNRIRSITLVHEQATMESRNLARIDLADYLEVLVNHLLLSYGVRSDRIALKMDVANVFLDVSTAIPCGLIVNELVSNSIRHAFPDGRDGEIQIRLGSNDPTQFALTISDNGIGLPKNLDPYHPQTLGLELIHDLTLQIGGTFQCQRVSGTSFTITFTPSGA